MEVDWLTVAAQVINFLILIALLWRFLYRPIITTMEARQQHIENQMLEARQLKTQAEDLIATYQEQLDILERERQTRLKKAIEEVESEQLALLEKARLEVEQKRLEWQRDLAKEQVALLHELKTLLAEQLVELGRKAFRDLAGRSLENCVVESFIEKLADLSEERRRQMYESNEWKVMTAFPLDSTYRVRIETALNQIKSGVSIHFEQRKDLICGIALEIDGRIWHWNLGAYLDELERLLSTVLPAETS